MPETVEERRARRRAYYVRNIERERARSRDWRNANLEKAKAVNRVALAKWRAANPERVARERREYHQANRARRAANQRRRRARLKEVSLANFTFEDLEQRLSMYAGCWICGKPEWEHVDHVKPLAKGGPHILANLRPACAPCNIRKGATWPFPSR